MNIVLHTRGDGFWSEQAKPVTVTGFDLAYVNDEGTFGELRVYFDTATWNVNKDGLIYTDNLFIRELRTYLCGQLLNGKDVDYSEQGMQGRDYVSCDVGANFLKSWQQRFNSLETTV
jgi:hypothetical protein